MAPLTCYWCKGHKVVLVNGVKVECRECGGTGLDGDVIRENERQEQMGNDDRDWAQERDRKLGIYSE